MALRERMSKWQDVNRTPPSAFCQTFQKPSDSMVGSYTIRPIHSGVFTPLPIGPYNRTRVLGSAYF